jgi:hypothetical protein
VYYRESVFIFFFYFLTGLVSGSITGNQFYLFFYFLFLFLFFLFSNWTSIREYYRESVLSFFLFFNWTSIREYYRESVFIFFFIFCFCFCFCFFYFLTGLVSGSITENQFLSFFFYLFFYFLFLFLFFLFSNWTSIRGYYRESVFIFFFIF